MMRLIAFEIQRIPLCSLSNIITIYLDTSCSSKATLLMWISARLDAFIVRHTFHFCWWDACYQLYYDQERGVWVHQSIKDINHLISDRNLMCPRWLQPWYQKTKSFKDIFYSLKAPSAFVWLSFTGASARQESITTKYKLTQTFRHRSQILN